MLEVETNHQIILMYFKEGLSLRQIAKKLHIHRDTVRARIDQHKQFKALPSVPGDTAGVLITQYLQTGAVYDSSTRKRRKLNDEIIGLIDTCLAENEAKRLDGRHKQQLKKIDIHEKVVDAGYSISYSVVCDYIATKILRTKEAFIKQGYEAGMSCEFDWGEVKIKVDGVCRRVYMAVFTSSYSNYRYAILFERQNSLAFKEAHIIFFSHVDGVWCQMIYDNMRVAIAKFVGKTEKVPTEALLQLSRWYLFKWRFCNLAKGNEKGHVERSVEVIRRKSFAFKDEFQTFGEAQQYLCARVEKLNKTIPYGAEMSPYDRLQQERKGLYAHPGKMECFFGENLKVDNYATVCVGTNRYSVPDRLSGRMVFVKSYSSHIQVYDANEVICQHPRSYERFTWQINLDHYLVTLKRKPGAVAGSIALKQAPSWIQSLYAEHFIHNPRSFIELLQYCQAHEISHQQLRTTINTVSNQHPCSVDTDHIIALLGNQPDAIQIVTENTGPDPIAVQSLENLSELASMMN